jgi:hypothetical protein
MAEYNPGGLGGVLQSGGKPLGQWLGGLLLDRRAAKQLNPVREALLNSQPSGGYVGPMANQQAIAAQGARTPQQQMIMAAAQDPKTFGQLAQQYGPLELGAAIQGAPRVREVIVHGDKDDPWNTRLGIGLKEGESASVKLQYDANDKLQPGFTVETYKTADDARGDSAGLAEVASIDEARVREGRPKMTSPEIEKYLQRKQGTSGLVQAYENYQDEGGTEGFDLWRQRFASQQAVAQTSGDVVAKRLDKMEETATEGLKTLSAISDGIGLLDKGVMTGTMAEGRLALARTVDTILGRETDETAVSANTDAYIANAGRLVGKAITQFGAGTGLSDADRQYARQIAGGEITMTETALRKALEILSKGATFDIQRFNQRIGGLDAEFKTLSSLYDPIQIPEMRFTKPGATAPNGAPAGGAVMKFDVNGNLVQ